MVHIGSEFRWILKGFTPDTIPMARLAEYMQQLSKLFGQEAEVHFVRVEEGSVALVSTADGAAGGRVSARVGAIKTGLAPADAVRAFDALNRMVAEDNTSAYLRDKSAVILRFPGKQVEQTPVVEVADTGSVIGHLYALLETPKEVHARIRIESGGTLMCTVSADVAKKLREYLFETVKVSGEGVWGRDPHGAWTVQSFEIKDVVKAESDKLRAIVEELRRLEIDWPDDPLGYLETLDGEDGTFQ